MGEGFLNEKYALICSSCSGPDSDLCYSDSEFSVSLHFKMSFKKFNLTFWRLLLSLTAGFAIGTLHPSPLLGSNLFFSKPLLMERITIAKKITRDVEALPPK